MPFTDEEIDLLKNSLKFDDYPIEVFEQKGVNYGLIKELQDFLLQHRDYAQLGLSNINSLIYSIITDRLSPGEGERSTVGINELLRAEIDRMKEDGEVLGPSRSSYFLPSQGGRKRKSRRRRKSRRSRKSRRKSRRRY